MLNFIRKKKVDSAREKTKREKSFLNYSSISDVLILFNLKDWEEVLRVAEHLRQDKKTVTLWSVRPKEKQEVQIPQGIKIIDAAKDRSWTQSLAKPIIEDFQKENYDTLLDLTTMSDSILEYLLAMNDSKFCIGIRENESKEKVYDFVLLKKEEDDIFTTFEQMKYYLGKIN